MKVFRTYEPDFIEHGDRYFATRAEAKAAVRKDRRDHTMIEELDVKTDREGVLAMLNGEPVTRLVAHWDITPRGALKEAVL